MHWMKQPLSTALLLTALLGTTQVATGQPGGGRPTTPAAPRAATGRIIGTVTDAATSKPVSYATVAVLDAATGKVVSGGVCGDDGRFVLPGIPAGTYTVEVSFLGYKTLSRPGVAVPADGPADLGPLALAAAAQQLNEVVVTAQKALIEEKVDRTVYNAENDQTTRGGDATDVLKRVPLLSVDLDGNVSLRGSSNIKVLINNKPSTIAASSIADALKQIPADQIKTVEVITSPSAKYDAEGTGGIINIITKQNNLRGGTLGIDASGGTRSSNLSLQGSYRTGKMGVSLGAFGRAGYNIPGSFANEQRVKDAAGTVVSTTFQQAETRLVQVFGRSVLGWDYDLDKHNALTASLSYGTRNSRNHQDRLTTASSSGQGSSVRDVRVTDLSGTVDASLTYTRTFDKPQQEFSLLTLYSRNDRTNDFTNTILNAGDFSTASRLRNDNPSANEEYTVQADYQTPTSKAQLLEFGGKDILRRVQSDYRYYSALGADGAFAPLPGLGRNNGFTYRQNVASAYASYTVGLPNNFTLKPGLRYEYTTIMADFNTAEATTGKNVVVPDYGVLVPSVNLSRKLANGNVLKAAYNRRLQRPSLQFLNPNIQAANPLIITQGNPTLGPEYTHNYELGYSTLVKRANLNFSAYARNTTGSIQAVRTPLADGVQQISYANIGEENAYGGSVFASINSKKLSLNGGTDLYYAVLRNNVADPLYNARNEGPVASARVFGSYRFTEVWGLQAFAFYRARQVQLQGYQSGFGIYSLSVRREFAEKKGSIGFGAENFFTPSITIRNQVATPLLDQTSSTVLRNMSFKLNVSYRIGKLAVDQRRRGARSINNDDLKGDSGGTDLGGGGGGNSGGGAPAGGGSAPSSGRPGGAGSTQPGGARPGGSGQPGAPAGTSPRAAPGAQPSTSPDAPPSDSTQTRPPGQPGNAPATPAPTTQPAAGPERQPVSPPTTPVNSPTTTPASGAPAPGGTTPAGSPGGRP